MKILHIITGLNDGGAEAVLYRICEFDKENKHVVISLMDEGKYGPLLIKIGVDVHTLNFPNGKVRLSGLIKLFKLIRSVQPDVVQTWMYHADLIGGVVARLAGVKNIVWGVHHTTLVKGESKRSTIFIAKINAFLSRFVPQKIIYCAEKSREVQESIGFKQSKGVVVPNGFNTNNFQPTDKGRSILRKELGVDDDVFLIGHVGRFSPYKDYPTLIQTLNKVLEKEKNIQFVLVGTGLDYQNSKLLDLFPSTFDKTLIFLLGRRNDVPTIMNGMDLFVLSSVSEAFPNVLNEAMACGTPCVTTDVGDASIIVGETGWVVSPKNPNALADEIIQAIEEKQNSPQDWLTRTQACRSRIIDNFSIEKMVSGYHRVWSNK